MDDDSVATRGAFDFITDRQAEVLDLLANNRTSKEMAFTLGVSEAAINRRIEVLRSRLGGVTRHELARRYRDWCGDQIPRFSVDPACVENGNDFLQLPESAFAPEGEPQDGTAADRAFRDALHMRIDAPWSVPEERRVVPRVLDGKNATLARGAAIAFILLATIASLVLGLAAALALTEAMAANRPGP
jgi:Response regulator containing a CheY-like receiver domain and an HTH DNA-binding domain